jgi:hypothetical protein
VELQAIVTAFCLSPLPGMVRMMLPSFMTFALPYTTLLFVVQPLRIDGSHLLLIVGQLLEQKSENVGKESVGGVSLDGERDEEVGGNWETAKDGDIEVCLLPDWSMLFLLCSPLLRLLPSVFFLSFLSTSPIPFLENSH